MNRIFCVSVLILTASFCFASVSAQKLTAQQMLQATKFLQDKPFDEQAPTIRAAAVKFAIETKDVTVTVCGGDITKPFLDKANKNSAALIAQYTIAMTALKMANPTAEENAIQLAALNSVLKTYEAMIREKPKTQFAPMDEYIGKRDRGELQALVEKADCGKKN